ncbi:hypothetical protein N7520_000312 [Penicillium odoratum]|uniref:uncharacterized protein n=1 Tax=Penicillium odoratum TaxID=1167516 RepID=UPI0025488B15|nr:uncharacterized protein N7520_000312 [Penicillium odoratum]KAJ5777066.1 hypothetical protein N7520_000312 [Penicillium odoratum]
MSREIDQLTVPAEKRKVKVIVASPSRSGTLGLYRAMQILGFNTYHIYECVVANELSHLKIFIEAITAHYNQLSGIKRYDLADCEKWLANYDCLIEIPSYVGMDVIEAYADDPDVKFILTERNPEKWARSVNSSTGQVAAMAHTFPFNILKYFHSTLYHFLKMNAIVYQALAAGTKIGDVENEKMLCRYYQDYIKRAKATIPADRLCLINIDKHNLDWDAICPFLGLPVPKEEYPDRNEPEKFQAMVKGFLEPIVKTAAIRFGVTALTTLGVLGWASMKYGPSILVALTVR